MNRNPSERPGGRGSGDRWQRRSQVEETEEEQVVSGKGRIDNQNNSGSGKGRTNYQNSSGSGRGRADYHNSSGGGRGQANRYYGSGSGRGRADHHNCSGDNKVGKEEGHYVDPARQSSNRRGGGVISSRDRNAEVPKSKDNTLFTISDASADVKSFWRQIKERVSFSKQFQLREDERKLWLETWKAAADGAVQGDILLKALLSLPDSAAVTPPIGVTIQVLRRIIDCVESSPERGISSVVASLEAIGDIVRRIKCSSEPIPEEYIVRSALNEIGNEFKTAIFLLMKKTGCEERLANLLLHHQPEVVAMKDSVLRRMIKPYESTSENANIHTQPWNGWRENPTLGWLMNGSWHRETDLRSSYSSAEEYASTLSRLWTLLTFYWGSGIVAQ